MGYQALLYCADEKAIRGATQVLKELDFSVETCGEHFSAVKLITAQHFDALLVDCENEQNATLLFKTARNSAINNASLLVALVQEQAGIAKAFRLGANLVLTKPINIEQSKGTLRVARGLLRKAEAGKAAAASAGTVPSPDAAVPSHSPEAPVVSEIPAATVSEVKGLLSSPSTVAAAPEPEASPKPDMAAAALQESKPVAEVPQAEPAAEPAASALAKAAAANAAEKAPTVPEEPKAEKSAKRADKSSGTASHGEVSQISLAVAEVKGSRRSDRKSDAGVGSAATAAAPAKESPQPVADPAVTKSAASKSADPTDSAATKSAAAKPADPKPVEAKPAEPPKDKAKVATIAAKKMPSQIGDKKAPASYAWLDESRDQQSTAATGSKRNLAIAAVLVIGLAVGGYFAWPRLEPMLMSYPVVQKYLGPLMSSAPAPTDSAPAPAPQPATAGSAMGNGIPNRATASSSDLSASAPAGTPANAGTSAAASPTAASPAATTPNSTPGQPVQVPQAVSEGLLLTKTDPIYPPRARQMRVAGNVQLQADIAKDGSVTQVKPLSGDPALARAAMTAVRQWKYKPYSVNGQATDFQTEITVNFSLP